MSHLLRGVFQGSRATKEHRHQSEGIWPYAVKWHFCGLKKREGCLQLGNVPPVGRAKDRSDSATCRGASNM